MAQKGQKTKEGQSITSPFYRSTVFSPAYSIFLLLFFLDGDTYPVDRRKLFS